MILYVKNESYMNEPWSTELRSRSFPRDRFISTLSYSMGYDLVAYLDVDQERIQEIITRGSYDIHSWEDSEIIVTEYLKLSNFTGCFVCVYEYNDACEMHEIWSIYSTGFLRDDPHIQNRRFLKMIEAKAGKEVPVVLTNMNFYIRTAEDAAEAASGLEAFFAEDKWLVHFAQWLRETAKYCSTYELSY